MRRLWLVGFLWVCVATAQSLSTDPNIATVETTADASVHGGKFDGTAEILQASGAHDSVLLRFRTALIEKWTVQKAVVAFHTPKGAAVPTRVMVAAVRESWNQGSVTPPHFGEGASVATRALKDDWVTFELPASIANQLASGESASIAISVAEGDQLSVHSRRTVQFSPYLLVRGQKLLVKQL